MANLIKIGNSLGISISESIIEKAQLAGKRLEFEVVENGLLIKPMEKVRQGWEKSVKMALAKSDSQHQLNQEEHDWLNLSNKSD